jgi:hypothetical protein
MPEWAGVAVFSLVGGLWLFSGLPWGKPVVSPRAGRTMVFSPPARAIKAGFIVILSGIERGGNL